jgi:GntR family transcriptional regulator
MGDVGDVGDAYGAEGAAAAAVDVAGAPHPTPPATAPRGEACAPSLRLRPGDPTPVFRQIAYQLSYQITSGRLSPGSRLPAVRQVAADLGVGPSNVAEAYRMLQAQGLVDASVGRGTFVSTPTAAEPDVAERQALLSHAIERLVRRGRSMGFGNDELRHHVHARLGGEPAPATLLLAAPTQEVGRKYATSIEARLGVPVEVVPVTIAALERRDPVVDTLLETGYFVVTFARFVREVEAACGAARHPHRVVGFGTVVQPATIEALRALGPGERICLITRDPTLDPALNLIAEHAQRGRDDVWVCETDDEATARAALAHSDRVLYTYTARPFVQRLGVPAARRLELEFDVTDDSLRQLRRLLHAEGSTD